MGFRLFPVALMGLSSFCSLATKDQSHQIVRSSAIKTMTGPRNHRLEQLYEDKPSSFSPIAGYIPLSSVVDQSRIDLDQKALEQQFSIQTQESFEKALRIYREGAFSNPVAEITLLAPLDVAFWKGTPVIGISQTGNRVDGKLYHTVLAGETDITIQYDNTGIEEQKCQVRANPEPILDGCLMSIGLIELALDPDTLRGYSYTYDPEVSTVNKRTIQSFSITSEDKMYRCPFCPLEMYEKFYLYYGRTFDYANQVVLAAFEGKSTNFDKFNIDFGLGWYELYERPELIQKGELIQTTTVFMIIWMKVIERMENAISKCRSECVEGKSCNTDAINSWDEAVAYYTGSLEGPDGSGNGVLLYAEADKRCVEFKTCGENHDSLSGTSGVNIDIFQYFKLGQSALGSGECEEARAFKTSIEQKMIILLVQGTLRHAWAFSAELTSYVSWGKGIGYLFSSLPIVHFCDADAAMALASNMETNVFLVKAALESTYNCLGITPLEVGGLWDSSSKYYFAGFEPEGLETATPTSTSTPSQTSFDNSSQAPAKAPTLIPTDAPTISQPTIATPPIPVKIDENLAGLGSGSPRLEPGRLLTQTAPLLLLVDFLVYLS